MNVVYIEKTCRSYVCTILGHILFKYIIVKDIVGMCKVARSGNLITNMERAVGLKKKKNLNGSHL